MKRVDKKRREREKAIEGERDGREKRNAERKTQKKGKKKRDPTHRVEGRNEVGK